MRLFPGGRGSLVVALAASVALGASAGLLGVCGPFADVAADAFCPFVLGIFTLGITTGTTPTTYDPSSSVTRLQMAAFLSRTVDGVVRRGSRRAAMNQFFTPQAALALAQTTVQPFPQFVQSDGADLWVVSRAGSVRRVRASDGRSLATWTAEKANGVLAAMGKIFVAGYDSTTFSGYLFMIDPSYSPGFAPIVAINVGHSPGPLAYDGSRFWTANEGVSIVTPAPFPSLWTVTTVTTGFLMPTGIVYDGSSVWLTDYGSTTGRIHRLDGSGAVLQTVTLGPGPLSPIFDGGNLWVPNHDGASVSVVRASNGTLLATLTGNGLSLSNGAAFDGERILVTNGTSVSLWKAADLTPLGNISTGTESLPSGACSDGLNFWVALYETGVLQRF